MWNGAYRYQKQVRKIKVGSLIVHIFPHKSLLHQVLDGSTWAVRVNMDHQKTDYLHIVGALSVVQCCTS